MQPLLEKGSLFEELKKPKKNLTYNLYIPSKGRWDTCLTADLLDKYGIKFFIVVEPQDAKKYQTKYNEDQILVMDKNNGGLGYVRAWIKKHSISKGEEYHWQLDDDVKNFQERIEDKNVNVNPLEMFCKIESYARTYNNIHRLGLCDAVFAWARKDFCSLNKLAASVVLFSNDNDILWETNLLGEDIIHTWQVLSAGYCTLLFNRYVYDKVPNNSGKGGHKETNAYKDGIKRTIKKYPFLKTRVNKKTGERRLAPVRWSMFKQTPIKRRRA